MKLLQLVVLLVVTACPFYAEGGQGKGTTPRVRVILLPIISQSAEHKITQATIYALRNTFKEYESQFELSYVPHGYQFGSKFAPQMIDLDTRKYLSRYHFDLDKLINDTRSLSADAILLYRFTDQLVTNWPEDIFMDVFAYLVDIHGRQTFEIRGGADGTFNDDGEGDIRSISEKLFRKYLAGAQPPRRESPKKVVVKKAPPQPKPQPKPQPRPEPAPQQAPVEHVSQPPQPAKQKCTTEQILQMVKMGLTDSQVKAACD